MENRGSMSQQTAYRTHHATDVTEVLVGEHVTLAGWVDRRRDHGGVAFIDLRDNTGLVQVVINEEEMARPLRSEYVIEVDGKVRQRPEGNENDHLATGKVEVVAEKIRVLAKSDALPFQVSTALENESENKLPGEDVRLKYRYLDLRRPAMQRNIKLRSDMMRAARTELDKLGFTEVETPTMIKSTPEGARDFVVPARLVPGSWYALPQSPQLLKQLLMVGGVERYYQVAKCFRDEDLRADRQPEFTQIDCEMSFVEQEDVLNMFEGMMRTMFKNVLGVDIPNPMPRMSWYDAMDKYGSDKPDVRFGMTIHEITDKVKGKGFSVLEDAAYVGAIAVPGGAEYTRKQIDELTEWVKRPQVGAKGLIYIKLNADGSVKSSIDKFYSPDELKVIAEAVEAKTGDIVFVMSGDSNRKVQTMLGVLRIEMGNRLGLRDPKVFAPLWIVDFPLLEWSEEDGRFYAMHHPFTAPKPEHMNWFYSNKKEDLEKVCANAYDFVLNGTELGGGSIRIHDAEVQKRMFEVLGIGPEEAEYKFGFIIHAFQYGAPPHGGLAFGFDRVCTLFAGKESIRDFIAFPKNNQGRDVMIDAPSKIDQTQLDELSLDLRPQQEK